VVAVSFPKTPKPHDVLKEYEIIYKFNHSYGENPSYCFTLIKLSIKVAKQSN
jgi:hypothetical protein